MKLPFPLMQPILADHPPASTEWIHQIKYDGIRLLTVVDSSGIQLYTRNQNIRNRQYPELVEQLKMMTAASFILDGEVVIRDASGTPSFAEIVKRDRTIRSEKISEMIKSHPIEYQVFDLLMKDGKDLRSLPLSDRMKWLDELISPNNLIRFVTSETDGKGLYDQMVKEGWEGIVSKDLQSPYLSGKQHQAWYKIKITQQLLGVVGGVQYKQDVPNSLLLGIYRQGDLVFIGKAATGLSSNDLRLLHQFSPQLAQPQSPFVDLHAFPQPVRWLQPQLTVQVEYTELTAEWQMRHPKIIGFTTQPAEQARWKE